MNSFTFQFHEKNLEKIREITSVFILLYMYEFFHLSISREKLEKNKKLKKLQF